MRQQAGEYSGRKHYLGGPQLETPVAEFRLSTWPVLFLLALRHRCGSRLEADFGMRAVAKRFFARSSTTTQKHGGLACVDPQIAVEQFDRELRPCTAHFLSGNFDVSHFYVPW
jgi:hypothetical protein